MSDTERESRLLANLRHELRTPLNAIIGYSEILLEEAKDEGLEDLGDLQKIHVAGKELLALVDDILDPQTVGAELDFGLRPPLNGIIAYAEILLEDVKDKGREGFISDLQKIHTAAQHFGALIDDVASLKIGAGEYGALMGIFAEEAQPVQRSDVGAGPQFDAQMGQRLPLRILLAEDNVINQQVALSFLERLGYRADVAANGLEALQSLRRQPYDVVLMDVQMPEVDGLEATRRIRQEFAAEAQPHIIAMTANAMGRDREACLVVGMEDYISKPVQVGELVAALSKCQPKVPRKRSQVVEGPAAGTRATAVSPTVSAGPEPVKAVPPQVLDPGALKQLRATLGKQADRMLPGLIEGFYDDVDRLLGDVRQALEQGQAGDLRRAAHSLKSGSATFGATALSAVARELEYLARDGVLEGVGGLIARAESEFVTARAALETVRKER
jgi:CheY-like chemotaxis protein/HPt (histidine-containing phosphotransfer) domain-containing protein